MKQKSKISLIKRVSTGFISSGYLWFQHYIHQDQFRFCRFLKEWQFIFLFNSRVVWVEGLCAALRAHISWRMAMFSMEFDYSKKTVLKFIKGMASRTFNEYLGWIKNFEKKNTEFLLLHSSFMTPLALA